MSRMYITIVKLLQSSLQLVLELILFFDDAQGLLETRTHQVILLRACGDCVCLGRRCSIAQRYYLGMLEMAAH